MDHYHILYFLSVITEDKSYWYVGESQSQEEFSNRVKARCKKWGINRNDPQLYIYSTSVEIPKDATYRDCEQGLKNECSTYLNNLSFNHYLENTNEIECSAGRSKTLINPKDIKATEGPHKGTSLGEYVSIYTKQFSPPPKIYSRSYKYGEVDYPVHLCPF